MKDEPTILAVVQKAFLEVCEKDKHLLEINANERSITHRLAVYIEKHFEGSGYHVDCESNRANRLPKRLRRFTKRVGNDDTKGSTVFRMLSFIREGRRKIWL